MQSNWIKVLLASIFEVLWVIGLKHADGVWAWTITLIFIIMSFYLLIKSTQKLPVGTVYAVFVGLGTTGTILSDIIIFGEPVKIEKVLLIALLLTGVIGLKLITDTKGEKGIDS